MVRPINLKVKQRLAAGGLAASLILAGSALVAPWEGLELQAYPDVIGVYTICYGQTKGVKLGDKRTETECYDDLALSLPSYRQNMLKYVTVPLTPYQEAAFISFSYNVGTSAFGKSTLVKKLNKGDYQGACSELKKWVYADNKKFQGLVNRREDEYLMCIGAHPALRSVIPPSTVGSSPAPKYSGMLADIGASK